MILGWKDLWEFVERIAEDDPLTGSIFVEVPNPRDANLIRKLKKWAPPVNNYKIIFLSNIKILTFINISNGEESL